MPFYPSIPAGDGTSLVPPANALFQVYELTDIDFTTPLPLTTSAGVNAAPLLTSAQGVVPPVNVTSPNLSHIFKSGSWEWRRDSFDGAAKAVNDARAAAEAAALSAEAPTDESVDRAIARADLPKLAADAVGSSPTVTAAASAAVEGALGTAGVVQGRVDSTPSGETDEYRGGFIGENGRPTDLVFDKYGKVAQGSIDSWAPRLAPLIGVEKATGTSSSAAGGLVGENGRETDIVFDSEGRIIDRTIADWAPRIGAILGTQLSAAPTPKVEPRLGLGRGVYVRDRAGAIRLQTSRPDQFLALGDSLTDGYPRPPYATDGSDSWPGVLQGLLGKTVHNLAVQGQTADEIAIRAGSLVPHLMPEGGAIPASGPVAVTNPGQFITWRTDRGWSDTGSLAGVPGRFSRTGGQPLMFTRTTAGTAVAVATPQPWVSNGAQYSEATTLMMLGRNDVAWSSPGTVVIDRIVAANVAVIESRTPIHPRFLVMGTLNSTGEYTNSAGWTTVTESNRILSQMYPDNYLDIRSYLVHESIYDQGITPTADDLARMGKDAPPTSIMQPGDGIHYTQATAATVARRVHKELKLKGWAA